MNKNVCVLDRVIRILLGIALIGATLAGVIGVWGWIGAVPLATGLIGFCPLYRIFGVNSCSIK